MRWYLIKFNILQDIVACGSSLVVTSLPLSVFVRGHRHVPAYSFLISGHMSLCRMTPRSGYQDSEWRGSSQLGMAKRASLLWLTWTATRGYIILAKPWRKVPNDFFSRKQHALTTAYGINARCPFLVQPLELCNLRLAHTKHRDPS